MTLRGCTSASGIRPQSLLMTEHACSDSCVQAETRVLLWHASERDIGTFGWEALQSLFSRAICVMLLHSATLCRHSAVTRA